MKKILGILVPFLLLIVTLLLNNPIKFYGLISLFLILPYFIHWINLSVREKLAKKDNFLGREAQEQLILFRSKGYRLLMFIPTLLLGIGLFIVYIFLMMYTKQVVDLSNVILLGISGVLLGVFLWQFYSELKIIS